MAGYDEIWDDVSLRKKISKDFENKEYCDILSLLSIENIIEIHYKVAKIGITKRTGVRNEKHLTLIFDEFRNNVDERVDIIYNCYQIYEKHCSL